MTLHRAGPVLVVDLFPAERAALLELLTSLAPEDWQRATVCAGWTVKDIAAHLVADDLGRLSRDRDGHAASEPLPGEPLGRFIDRQNGQWVEATRRLSPRVLRWLLESTAGETQAYFASLDLDRLGGPVSWAGPQPAPVWLDVAREYTERWHHQAQIRDAVDAPPLDDPTLFAPVLATFAFALPRAFADVDAEPGTSVHVSIEGTSGGDWTVVREGESWMLYRGRPSGADATVVCGQDTAWRLFTRTIAPEAAEARAQVDGDAALARRVFQAAAIIV